MRYYLNNFVDGTKQVSMFFFSLLPTFAIRVTGIAHSSALATLLLVYDHEEKNYMI